MSDTLLIISVVVGVTLLVVLIVGLLMMFLPVCINLWYWWSDIVDDFFEELRWKD